MISVASTSCRPATTSRVPGGTSLAYEPASNGWMELHEPGWFVITMPTAPLVTLVPDRASRGPFTFKKLRLQTADGLFVMEYVEFGNDDDAQDAFGVVRDRVSGAQPTNGAVVGGVREIDVDGVRATESITTLAPRSELNDADEPVVTRARVFLQGRRFFYLQFAAPASRPPTDGDTFFGSFRFDRR